MFETDAASHGKWAACAPVRCTRTSFASQQYDHNSNGRPRIRDENRSPRFQSQLDVRRIAFCLRLFLAHDACGGPLATWDKHHSCHMPATETVPAWESAIVPLHPAS